MHQLTPLHEESIRQLNRDSIVEGVQVLRILRSLAESGIPLDGGINRRNEPRRAWVRTVSNLQIDLKAENFEHGSTHQIYFNFEFGGERYFFATSPIHEPANGKLSIALPRVIHRAERRDSQRRRAPESGIRNVELDAGDEGAVRGLLMDVSRHGIGVEVPGPAAGFLTNAVVVRFLDGERAGESRPAQVRYRTSAEGTQGWVRLGLAVGMPPPSALIGVERRTTILEGSRLARLRRGVQSVGSAVRLASLRAARNLGVRSSTSSDVPIVEYLNADGESIRAIIDSCGDTRGAPAVVIPPAWGRTKETLLPLAATLVESFRRAGQSITVVRFDGTHRRGESHIAPEFQGPGDEYLGFTFSKAVRDIQATLDFLRDSPRFAPRSVVLVTFSLSAIEGRRAMAEEKSGLICGWISVVGMVDLQSALKTISGGVDYAFGLLRGVRFGRHELVGVVADMDRTGTDALAARLVFLADARQDMMEVKVPVTWIHGRHDAWMDIERVRELLSSGDTSKRRLLEVPTGHQLRSSREAIETFQLVAREVGRMTLGRELEPAIPNLQAVERRGVAERERLKQPVVHLRHFWRDYLVGRKSTYGIQLLTATEAYQRLMQRQIELLCLRESQKVADLGTGVGDFVVKLSESERICSSLTVHAFDFVSEGLRRAELRSLRSAANQRGVRSRLVLADLEVSRRLGIPAATGSYDAVLASLLIGYLREPQLVLEEIHRILRPGGRLVLSTLKRDADISKIHVDGLQELRMGRASQALGDGAAEQIDELARDFLNDASRILDLEERGRFKFWDPQEITAAVRQAGFRNISAELAFGDPPQAVLVAAEASGS